eukprot:CAMPEP_0172902670 /NCGR_PEP_ID=MMETSP1075-20121228/168904_1 /TAXON_ID=2916 /ORGANISM="Ceratium fusus, Strain PA161109" /LENGTH=93 /DNA_ID=CAMNT_0013759311 /DNA_START=193 /DNA_END=474 /DNA_ORIENTATION=-
MPRRNAANAGLASKLSAAAPSQSGTNRVKLNALSTPAPRSSSNSLRAVNSNTSSVYGGPTSYDPSGKARASKKDPNEPKAASVSGKAEKKRGK